jgi:hypothetical protein
VIGEWTVELFCNKARDATLGPMIFACGREHVIRLAHIAASAVSEEVQYEQSFEAVLSLAISEGDGALTRVEVANRLRRRADSMGCRDAGSRTEA